jgi:hypothetical protein
MICGHIHTKKGREFSKSCRERTMAQTDHTTMYYTTTCFIMPFLSSVRKARGTCILKTLQLLCGGHTLVEEKWGKAFCGPDLFPVCTNNWKKKMMKKRSERLKIS